MKIRQFPVLDIARIKLTLRSTRTADGCNVTAGSTVCCSARQLDPPLPGNGSPDMADDGSRVEPKPARCCQSFHNGFRVDFRNERIEPESIQKPSPTRDPNLTRSSH